MANGEWRIEKGKPQRHQGTEDLGFGKRPWNGPPPAVRSPPVPCPLSPRHLLVPSRKPRTVHLLDAVVIYDYI